ncbi:CHAP domain-containing protein [Actinocorallia sp. A-T 12471]|uniref:CHAP domain-containing protein n=1 Tax=Actinocorallia sp. A-T 12471 TaxID=3089813 RepID=UPI0029D0105B|nr:CHAP domain-containing protein [Actinocorallia sp. A-T 12471]MDX6741394.1 CHAP domain-containing protein [Actinocorallia sp. A-T 12471]
MDAVGQKLLDLAESELGYSEGAGGYTKFGDWWVKNVDDDVYFKTAPWCDMFIAWAADKAGVTEWVGQFAATRDHAQWFKEQDAWGTKPEPGAVVFFNWAGSKDLGSIQHVGLVKAVKGGKVVTIEANTHDTIAVRERDPSDIVGYGYPSKVEIGGMTFAETVAAAEAKTEAVEAGTTDAAYTPKHAAPAPSVAELVAPEAGAAALTGQSPSDGSGAHDLPIKEAALTGVVGIAVLAVLAIGVAKVAAARVPAAVAATPKPQVRKRGRHHRTSGAPPVALPVEMTHYDLDDAESGTLMMPAISAEVAQQAEDREFWGRIAHLKEDEELNFWTDLHTAVTSDGSATHAGRH